MEQIKISKDKLLFVSTFGEDMLLNLKEIAYIRLPKDREFQAQRTAEIRQQEEADRIKEEQTRKAIENIEIEAEIASMKEQQQPSE